jgi:hypothetical protein
VPRKQTCAQKWSGLHRSNGHLDRITIPAEDGTVDNECLKASVSQLGQLTSDPDQPKRGDFCRSQGAITPEPGIDDDLDPVQMALRVFNLQLEGWLPAEH